jgi:hypothetical protein
MTAILFYISSCGRKRKETPHFPINTFTILCLIVYLDYKMDYQVWNRGMQKSTYNKKKDIFMTWKTET